MRLDRRKFAKWLEAKPPTQVVGHKRDCHDCPLANFHDDASGWSVVISENGDGYRIDRGDGDRRLPWWASRFAMLVDREDSEAVTAGRALEILSRIDG